MAARLPGANSAYQAQGETPVNLNKAKENCLMAMMTIHPSCDLRLPPSAGRGGISDPGLYKLTCSVPAGEEAKLVAEDPAPYVGDTLCLMGALGKGLELCSQRSPLSSS